MLDHSLRLVTLGRTSFGTEDTTNDNDNESRRSYLKIST